MKLTWIGLGVMGYPMAGHLARAKHELTVYNRTRAKRRQAELLEENGGRDVVIKRGDLGFTPPPGYPIILG